MTADLRLLRLVPAATALAVALSVWGAHGATAASEEDHDELGYVVDVEALDDPAVIAEGEELFRSGCVSCHGLGGVGGRGGPSVVDSGAASAHFYLTSGRMPAAVAGQNQAMRKPPAYEPEQIEALVAYVASLGDGPPIPEVDLAGAHLGEGGELYRLHCAGCHSATAAGGALSYGRNAPTLTESTPVQVAEAIRVGPGQMPGFAREVLTDKEVDDIVSYVQYLRAPGDPGGFSLGRVGPIPEGFVAIIIGLGATVLAAFWVGKRRLETEDAA